MAIEKNTTGSNTAGTVTHKMLVKTAFGTFSISLFSNNPLHQAIAKKSGGVDFSDKFLAQVQGIEVVVPDDSKPAVDLDNYFD